MIKTIASATVLTAALVLSTGAFAANGNGNGNQGCLLLKTNTVYANPGKMFQAMRTTADGNGNTGDNPKQWLDSYPAYAAAGNNLGDFINLRCVTDNPAP